MSEKRKAKARTILVPPQVVSDLSELNWFGHSFEEMVLFALRVYITDRAVHLERVRALHRGEISEGRRP